MPVGSPSSTIKVLGQGECGCYGADDYGAYERTDIIASSVDFLARPILMS